MITGYYTAFIAIIFITLSVRIIRYRRANQLGLGDHGDKSLMKRMRAHANCAEYAPFGLLLMFMVEFNSLASDSLLLVHIIGGTLLWGRLLHAYGFSASPPKMILRQVGMLLTFTSFGISIICLLLADTLKP